MNPSVLSHPVASDASAIKERIYARIRPDMERIEAELERQLTSVVPLIGVVGRYIIRSGGKRLRPLLMILCARVCGYQGKDDAALSVVFEFLHAASLLHDDVVDHAELRRSKPAANTIWGNPAVVLVGDFLYSKAILITVGQNNIRMLEVLSDTTTKMAEGEVLQLINSDNLEITEQEYLEVITRKTAVLISAACRIGAIFAGGTAEQEQALRHYGHSIGIAFQLIDDALDYTGETKELGKSVGNDIQEGKATLPLIYALQNANPTEVEQIKRVFSADEISSEDFQTIRKAVARSGGIDYTLRRACEYIDSAKQAIEGFGGHPTAQVLRDMADYVVCRKT